MKERWTVAPANEAHLVRRSAHNVLDLLSFLAASKSPLTSMELAKLTGMHRASVYRNLESLTAEGWLAAGGTPRRYAVALSFRQLGQQALRHDHTHEVLKIYATQICDRLGVRTFFGYYEQGTYVTSETLLCIDGVPVSLPAGSRMLATCTSAGLILLAYQDEAEIERAATQCIPRFTDKTLTDPAEIWAAVRAAQAQGYAFSYGQVERERGSFAVPVIDATGVVASLGIDCPEIGPTDEAIVMAKELAQRASRELGYRLGARFDIP